MTTKRIPQRRCGQKPTTPTPSNVPLVAFVIPSVDIHAIRLAMDTSRLQILASVDNKSVQERDHLLFGVLQTLQFVQNTVVNLKTVEVAQ